MVNQYARSRCMACRKRKSRSSPLSPLLEVASAAVTVANSVEEALDFLPSVHRPAIPELVLAKLLSLTKPCGVKPLTAYRSPSSSIDSYFYWICGDCTMKNTYKRAKCGACERHKHASIAESSVLLEIATKASAKARTVEAAHSLLPDEQKMSIPESVLTCLVTCIATIGNKKHEQRRCLRPKAFGTDYCTLHCDPMLLSSVSTDVENKDKVGEFGHVSVASTTTSASTDSYPSLPNNREMEIAPSSGALRCSTKSHANIIVSMLNSLSESVDVSLANQLNWNIHCTEDAILCQENSPFPMGMLVRRFFPRYGFHDGRIVRVHRRQILDPSKGEKRPVLVYRLVYNDGDQEDLMHHEIHSLRQTYDQYNVESRSLPSSQLVPETLYECKKHSFVKIVGHITPAGTANPLEGGTVRVKFCHIGSAWDDLELDLTQLQLNIIRRLPANESFTVGPAGGSSCVKDEPDFSLNRPMSGGHREPERSSPLATLFPKPVLLTNKPYPSPVLEWPGFARSRINPLPADTGHLDGPGENETEKRELMITPGLWLHRKYFEDVSEKCRSLLPPNTGEGSQCVVDDTTCSRGGISQHNCCGWDPANAVGHVLWDPYGAVLCELCKVDKDDHQILICDGCHLGYHMYCVRPVIVNVPTAEWLCSRCTTGQQDGPTFGDLVSELECEPSKLMEFLSLPHDNPSQFLINHRYELDLFAPTTHVTKRQGVIGPSRSKATAKVGSLYFSRNASKNDWLIPLPILTTGSYTSSLASIVAAMKYCGMTSYSEELVYSKETGVTEDMNHAALDSVQPMSQRNLDIFKEFKHNLSRGAYPPIRIVHDENVGFSVEALVAMPRHTLISEYVGEVTTVERSGETSSDSLMILLETDDPKTSLIIDPTRTGNVSRFLSGINNRSYFSRRKANVRTRRFVLDGKCRVALFTAKKVEPGDKLHYDYNAGIEGKTVVEWASKGFYDTSNFF